MARSNRVLVVSPDPGLVNQVRSSLVTHDVVDVSDVATAEDALERCASAGLQLVIAEVDLPGITGHELCRRLKESDVVGIVALIFRHDDDRAAEQCLRAGADTTIGRPFQVHELAGALKPFVTSAEFNAPAPAEDRDPGSAQASEEESIADESLYSDYEFDGDDSIEGVRSIDTGSIRPADTAEMEAVKERGEFDEVDTAAGRHAESSVKIASLPDMDLPSSIPEPVLLNSNTAATPSEEVSGEGGGGTLRDMVAEHLQELTGDGSAFRTELKDLIREAISDAVLSVQDAAPGDPLDSEESGER